MSQPDALDTLDSRDLIALGLHGRPSRQAVKAAYRALARRFHPDTGGPTADPARFQAVHGAYEHLLEALGPERPVLSPLGAQAVAAYGYQSEPAHAFDVRV